jgi:hypothetical protein
VLPPIDASQDWFLSFREEEDGYTILEFSRNLTTCDPRDLDVKVSLTDFLCVLSLGGGLNFVKFVD